jgi:DNA-directed RNA polymerase omega subunit
MTKRTAAATPAPVPERTLEIGEADNKFRLVVIALQRARQLQSGARPRVENIGRHKFLWVALQEVMAGHVSWDVTPLPEPILATR